jgi:hypothetical protein
LTFTYATLVTGLSYSIAAKFVLQFGASLPSKKDFYQYQRIVADQIHLLDQVWKGRKEWFRKRWKNLENLKGGELIEGMGIKGSTFRRSIN